MKKRHILLFIAVLLSIALFAAGCTSSGSPGADSSTPGSSTAESSAPETPAGEERPLVGNRLIADFSTTDLSGAAVDQSLFAGYDVIMLNFWGTFCGPCIEEMPYLGEVAAEYAEKNVLVVGVVTDLLDANGNVDATVLEDGKHIVETTGANYTHLVPCDGLMPLMQQIYAVPTTVFINAEGYQLGGAQIGSLDKDGWCSLLDDLLERLGDAA